jgi:hypothetical protein
MITADGKTSSSIPEMTPENKIALEKELEVVKKQGKKLKKRIHEWTAAFTAANGREPTVEEKKADPKADALFNEYFKVRICGCIV